MKQEAMLATRCLKSTPLTAPRANTPWYFIENGECTIFWKALNNGREKDGGAPRTGQHLIPRYLIFTGQNLSHSPAIKRDWKLSI